jgi:hypothetical protein
MIMTISQMEQILAAGGSVVVQSSTFTLPQLTQMANAAGASAGTVTFKGLSDLTAKQLARLATIAPGHVVFDFT